nr:AraC family transcriptional regulator [Sphingomonas sp. Y57]
MMGGVRAIGRDLARHPATGFDFGERFAVDLSKIGMNLHKWELLSPDQGACHFEDAAIGSQVDLVAGLMPKRLVSWADVGLGMFVTDVWHPGGTAIYTEARSDVLAFEIGFDCNAERQYNIDNNMVEMSGLVLSLISIPKGAVFDVSTHGNHYKSFAIVVDIDAFMKQSGMRFLDIPPDVRSVVEEGRPCLKKSFISAPIRRATEDLLAHEYLGPISDQYYHGKCREIFALILANFCRKDPLANSPFSAKDVQKVEEVHSLLTANPTAELRVENLARRAAMNRTKLRSLFKQIYGTTISEYRTFLLMKKAEEMLRQTEMSVAEISYSLGYSDVSGFAVAFKKFFGHRPSSVRH